MKNGSCSHTSFQRPPDDLHSLMTNFQQWREEGTFCDMTLVASDGKEFPAHKLLVAASCDYVKALLSFEQRESNEIKLPTIPSEVS